MKALIRTSLIIGLLVPFAVLADGGSRIGYGGGLDATGAQSEEQRAIEAYNAGVELRDEALGYEQQAEAAQNAKKREKLLKKAGKSYTKAAEKFERAVQYNPQLHQAWSGFGHALRKTGDYHRALQAYNNALTLEPNYHEAIEYRAEAHMHMGLYEKVKMAYAKLKQEKPELAAKLLVAINKWLPGQDVNSNADLKAFAQWAKDMSGSGNPQPGA